MGIAPRCADHFRQIAAGLHAVRPGGGDNARHLRIHYVACKNVTVRSPRAADGAKAHRLYLVRLKICEKFRLLERRMQFQFDHCRSDLTQRQNRLQFGYGHIAHTQIPYQAHCVKPLEPPPCFHEFFQGKRRRVRVTGIAVTMRRMIIAERPMHEICIQIFQAQIVQRLRAGKQHLVFSHACRSTIC